MDTTTDPDTEMGIREATIADLYRAPDDGTYELVNGKLEYMAPTSLENGYVGSEILLALKLYQRERQTGFAVGDGPGFVVNLPHRRSFSPDVAWTVQDPRGFKRFVDGPPVFAVEVRSPSNSEDERARKRADYFAAGTAVVWDVDLDSYRITAYRHDTPDAPRVFQRGEITDAEPALPGWRVPVNDLFG